MSVLVFAWYFRYTRHILPFTDPSDGDDHGHDLCDCNASFYHGGPRDNGLNNRPHDDDDLDYNNHCNHCNDSNHDCGHCGGSDGVRKNEV